MSLNKYLFSKFFLNKSFVVWLIVNTQNQFGAALSAIAMSFLVLDQTNSVSSLSLTLALSFIPSLLMPFFGVLVDKINLKTPLILSNYARSIIQLGLGIAVLHFNEIPIVSIYLLSLINGVLSALSAPASNAVLPNLVQDDQLAAANGTISSFRQGAWFLGYISSGLIVSYLNPSVALIFDGITYLISGILIQKYLSFNNLLAIGEDTNLISELFAGFKIINKSWFLILASIISFFINATAAPVQALVPAILRQTDLGANAYSAYLVAETLGLLISGMLFTFLGNRMPSNISVAVGLMLVSIEFLAISFNESVTLYIISGAISGISIGFINIPIATFIGMTVDKIYLGRVFSILSAIASAALPLTLLTLSYFADQVSHRYVFLSCSFSAMIIATFWIIKTIFMVNQDSLKIKGNGE